MFPAMSWASYDGAGVPLVAQSARSPARQFYHQMILDASGKRRKRKTRTRAWFKPPAWTLMALLGCEELEFDG